MPALPPVTGAERSRARRWDALILGSGISALVAAARLGMAGHRVLVIEEDAARALPPAVREPFFLSGLRDQGVLDVLLRELKIPLIDQRRMQNERLAMQVVSPKFRFDWGSPTVTARELVAWRLADRNDAGRQMRALGEATEAERQIMLKTPFVRLGRRLGRPKLATTGAAVRGLPAELARPSSELGPVFEAICSALSNLATTAPTPEARARLLGSGLAGGAGFADGPPWLHALLRRRVEAVYGEFRTLSDDPIQLVSVDGAPAVHVPKTGDLWVGRVLALAASTSALAARLEPTTAEALFGSTAAPQRRVAVHFRAQPDVVPQGMAPRVALMRDALLGAPSDGLITLNACADEAGRGEIDLVARMRLLPGDDLADAEANIVARVRELMPFSEGRLEPRPFRLPLWDDDDLLDDPASAAGWPTEIDLRLSTRPPVLRLDRAAAAGLGLEGDLLLGWRGGDAIAEELA